MDARELSKIPDVGHMSEQKLADFVGRFAFIIAYEDCCKIPLYPVDSWKKDERDRSDREMQAVAAARDVFVTRDDDDRPRQQLIELLTDFPTWLSNGCDRGPFFHYLLEGEGQKDTEAYDVEWYDEFVLPVIRKAHTLSAPHVSRIVHAVYPLYDHRIRSGTDKTCFVKWEEKYVAARKAVMRPEKRAALEMGLSWLSEDDTHLRRRQRVFRNAVQKAAERTSRSSSASAGTSASS